MKRCFIGYGKAPLLSNTSAFLCLPYILLPFFLSIYIPINSFGNEPEYSRRTCSISWLLMPWQIVLPGHQQPWYWLSRINQSLNVFENVVCKMLFTLSRGQVNPLISKPYSHPCPHPRFSPCLAINWLAPGDALCHQLRTLSSFAQTVTYYLDSTEILFRPI